MNRRAALGLLVGGAALATGATLLASDAEAVMLPKLDGADAVDEGLVQDAQYIILGRRRRRRWVCWRNRWGRRVCAWR